MGDQQASSARKAQNVFASSAARTWTSGGGAASSAATPSRPFGANPSTSTYTSHYPPQPSSQTSRMTSLREHHHKRSAFPIAAKFTPAVWEKPLDPEQKVEAELASWHAGYSTDRTHNRRARLDNLAASSDSIYAPANPYLKSAQLIRSPLDEIDVLASRGYQAAELVGTDRGIPFPLPASSATRVAQTQTEAWGEYGSAVTRIQQLAAQVKHLYKLNQGLEEELVKKKEETAQATREADALLANNDNLTRTMLGRQAEFERMQAEYSILRKTRDDSAEAIEKLRTKNASQKAHIQAQNGALAQYQRDKESMALALDYAALESEKLAELHREVRRMKEERERMTEQYAHAMEVDRQHTAELQAAQSREDDLRRSLESSQRLLDEHVRQTALDTQHLLNLKSTMDLRLAERDRTIEEQDAQLMRLRLVEQEHLARSDPLHVENQVVNSTLEQARANVKMLEEYNAALKERLMAAEKMINDLLTSSAYRKEVLVRKEKAIPPDERARRDAEKKKSRACAIM